MSDFNVGESILKGLQDAIDGKVTEHKYILVNGVPYKVTQCPPGRAEGASFQPYSFDRKSFGRISEANVNPPGEEPPAQVSLAQELMGSAKSLTELISEEE